MFLQVLIKVVPLYLYSNICVNEETIAHICSLPLGRVLYK